MQPLTKLLGPFEEEGLKSENSIPGQTRNSKVAQSRVGSSTQLQDGILSSGWALWGEGMLPF